MKKILYIGSVIVLLIIIGMVVLYNMLGSIIRTGVETVGPKATGGEVQLSDVDIRLLSGQVGLRGLVIGNPPGFKSKNAIEVGQVKVKVDTGTVTKDVVIIKNIFIDGVEITWEGLSGDNHKKIMENIAKFSKKKKPEAEKVGKEEKPGPEKKIIIDDFVFKNSNIDIILAGQKLASLALPEIHLTGIGRDEGGVTVRKAIERYYNEIFRSMKGCVANNHEMLIKKAQEFKAKGEELLKQGKETVEKGKEALKKGDIDSAVKGVLKGKDDILKGFLNK